MRADEWKPSARLGVCSFAILLALAGTATAQGRAENGEGLETERAATTADPQEAYDVWKAKRLTGDWWGVRTDLEDQGIKFSISLMNQLMVNMHGGQETKNGHDTAGSYEVNLYLDFDKMELVPGGSFFIRGKGTWGGDNSDFDKEKVGGLFKTNQDASSEEVIFVDKWWWTQMLADDAVEIRFGRMEPVKDLFDTSKVIGHEDKQFLNTALVRNATVPSDKGLGLYANVDLPWSLYFRTAAIDANSRSRRTNFDTAFHDEDEFRFYGEIGAKPKFSSARGDLWGHYRVGTWYDPKSKQQFIDTLGGVRADRFQSGDWGFYIGFDQMIWKESDDPKDKQGVTVAARYGKARGEVNRIEHFWAVAAQYEGLIPEREKDVLGLGFAQGILADEYKRVRPAADRESVVEMYYAIHVTPWLVISPDLQFIVNTGGDDNDPDTFVAGLRFKMSL